MRPLTPSFNNQKTGTPYRSSEKLPVGLILHSLKESADHLDITLPAFEEGGMILTFINYKGDLQMALGEGQEYLQQLSPGLGLLTASGKPLRFRSLAPINLSAVILFISRDWIDLFLKGNPNFMKIEQSLEMEDNILTCRLGRRQMSLLTAIMNHQPHPAGNLLEMQNNGLALLEYFLCNRHRNLLGTHTTTGIDNEEDLTLIREVESYISEYYCSDTFTVDSILKKTYTSYHKLNFLFKSIHGMTISEYIRNKRIEKSKEMIAANAKSISQIAYEIGYSSISNYILAFKKIYQMTPGKYKKQMES
jgi:AraC-like DNA-binding protein